MKGTLLGVAPQYLVDLRSHLRKQLAGRGLPEALALGRQAVTEGLETLELAQVHENALIVLGIGEGDHSTLKKAERFFSSVIIPIVEAHRVSRENRVALRRVDARLKDRTKALAKANLKVRQGAIRRRRLDKALKASGKRYSDLLRNSLHLQDRLRDMLRNLIAKQEIERTEISQKLQNDIAQALLGINVRLLLLKESTQVSTRTFSLEVDRARRQYTSTGKSIGQSVRRSPREQGSP